MLYNNLQYSTEYIRCNAIFEKVIWKVQSQNFIKKKDLLEPSFIVTVFPK